MKNPRTLALHDSGQRLWLDNITRGMLRSGTLQRYIADLSVTGLTSNPTIFERAIASGSDYDGSIQVLAAAGLRAEDLFFELALQDLKQAADLFRPHFDASEGLEGWVSLEVSPLLAHDSAGTLRSARNLHARAALANLMIKIPGTPAGLVAIEESIFAGIPVNVTLLFSCEHYLAAAQAYLRGLERRAALGLPLKVGCVASLFVSRWDVAIAKQFPAPMHNRLGLAVAGRTYEAYRALLASERWLRLASAGARAQRLLWASTGTKDPTARDTLYVEALGLPDTIDTIPEPTLLAYADHGQPDRSLVGDAASWQEIMGEFSRAGLDEQALAAQLQREGAEAFSGSWASLLSRIAQKSGASASA